MAYKVSGAVHKRSQSRDSLAYPGIRSAPSMGTLCPTPNGQKPTLIRKSRDLAKSQVFFDQPKEFAVKRIRALYDEKQFSDAALLISRTSLEELGFILPQLPVESILDQLPNTLVLLDSIYSKLLLAVSLNAQTSGRFPDICIDLLQPDRFLLNCVWIFAKEAEPHNVRSDTTKWPLLLPHLTNILKVIGQLAPHLRHQLEERKFRLDKALEGLGLHGLINYGESQLIELSLAIKTELNGHQTKLKSIVQKYSELTHTGQHGSHSKKDKNPQKSTYNINGIKGAPPSNSSHQRLMNLHLSELKDRLQRNEYSFQLIEDTFKNAELEALMRLIRKRIAYDREIVNEFQFLQKISNNFTLSTEDPILSKLFLSFSKAYERLLSLMPFSTSEDSGLGEELDSDSPNSPQSLASELTSVSQNRPKPFRKSEFAHKSSTKSSPNSRTLPLSLPNQFDNNTLKSAKSVSQLSLPLAIHRDKFLLRSVSQADLIDSQLEIHKDPLHSSEESMLGIRNTNADRKNEQMEMDRLRTEVINLRNELKEMRKPQRNPTELAQKFTNFYESERKDTLAELQKLPELHNSDELQCKILFSICVLSFRSVQKTVMKARRRLWDSLGENRWEELLCGDHSESPVVRNLDSSFKQYTQHRAKQLDYSDNTKDVTTQIYSTLFDFPSLKSCGKFNSFIQSCVKLAWELLSTEWDLTIEYQSHEYNGELHIRHVTSHSLSGTQIRKYLWPGLITARNCQCHVKGVVIT